MSERSFALLISTMQECISDITDFTKAHDYESFLLDKKTKYAVLRALEILGEAANRIPKSVRNNYPNIEWNRIIRSRNLIIHEYDIIDYEIVWRITTVHLPVLKEALENINNDFE